MLTKKKWALFSLLTLCGGTIYKLPSLKDAFYIPMQEYFHLTNGQIGNAMSVNSFVTTVGFFLSIYFADKLPRRYTMSFSLIATGLLGVYLTTMPGYWGILFVWALFGVTCDMMNWPVLLKSVSRLGNSEQQGRLFGFSKQGVALSIPWWHFLRWQYLPGLAVAYWVLKQASGSIPLL
ncbi:major facilitator superfamily protein [Escherichia coli]|uniref:Major facilitator superfamily protein n=1 Tax=Escherichia coli TaxID=562 RepID=A0A376TYT3_ECOLX|nr:major facilitator superfamily protein [Escherichia coli]